jgi:hypothetical protein
LPAELPHISRERPAQGHPELALGRAAFHLAAHSSESSAE